MVTELNKDNLSEIMKEMHERVGVKFHSLEDSCQDECWFSKYSWTQKEEDSFREWLLQYLSSNTKLPKRILRDSIKWFMLGYGWKVKE